MIQQPKTMDENPLSASLCDFGKRCLRSWSGEKSWHRPRPPNRTLTHKLHWTQFHGISCRRNASQAACVRLRASSFVCAFFR